MIRDHEFLDPFICRCFGGSKSSPPAAVAPTPPPPPPSKMDEGAAGRQAAVDQIRAANASGQQSTIGTSPLGDTSETPTAKATLLGS